MVADECTACFNATSDPLPPAPPGLRLAEVTFATCPTNAMRLVIFRTEEEEREGCLDASGLASQYWVRITAHKLPAKYMHLNRGSHSLQQLLRRYAFVGADGCVNHGSANVIFRAGPSPIVDIAGVVPPHLVQARGVRQPHVRSGACWFGTMMWVTTGDLEMRDFMCKHLKESEEMTADTRKKTAEIRQHLCAAVYDHEAAMAVRAALWYDCGIGDDVEAPPEQDGQNGCSEFLLMCGRYNIPCASYMQEEKGCKYIREQDSLHGHGRCGKTIKNPKVTDSTKPHLLLLRYQDGDHERFPVQPRIRVKDVVYRLVGIFLGQRRCGHQIGISLPGSCSHVCISDADQHKDGIGPAFLTIHENWWETLGKVVHITKFGHNYSMLCNHSPHNPAESGSGSGGMNSLDLVYITETYGAPKLGGATRIRTIQGIRRSPAAPATRRSRRRRPSGRPRSRGGARS